jgi:hypothetical protein
MSAHRSSAGSFAAHLSIGMTEHHRRRYGVVHLAHEARASGKMTCDSSS